MTLYSAWHTKITHCGARWLWFIYDFCGVITASGKADNRQEARTEMGKTIKKLRKL